MVYNIGPITDPWGTPQLLVTEFDSESRTLKVLGKSVGLCKTAKRKDQLYIRLLVSVLRIICENFNPNGLLLARL